VALWKVTCLESEFPGMWQRWFQQQAVGIGWPPQDGFRLDGPTPGGSGWAAARNALKAIRSGDFIVVALHGHRVGRIGQVTAVEVADTQWNPLVRNSKDYPHGEMGRRILVRWDLTVGPSDRDMVVLLPHGARLSLGELRPTLARVNSLTQAALVSEMNDPTNWVGLLTHFDYERALSGYIAAYPHRLEDGLLPHPNERVRERVFSDKTRSDVLLEDRQGHPVVVECKQGSPTTANINQLRGYMAHLAKETGISARGILVHGGSRKLDPAVAAEAAKMPEVEIVQYELAVAFSTCR
jgi:Domain of unknown function DUF83